MEQAWIHKAKTDGLFILLPTYLVLALVIGGHQWLEAIELKYSFFTWLFLIVFVDVAHVYATLFKTYFVKEEFQKRKQLYIVVPLVCFAVSVVLFLVGSRVFWSVLAYVAVFHFIRQQYGFMRLYARKEVKTTFNVFFDKLVIYTATVYPMLFWFLSPKRQFNWFMENEFFTYERPGLLQFLCALYFVIMATYVIRTLYLSFQQKFFNLPKHAIIIGTALSWYFGIVYYNNDLIFTLLNVVAHGIPYIALIYLNEIQIKSKKDLKQLALFKGVFYFVGVLLVIAFVEEYLWEILVWNDHFSIDHLNLSAWGFLIVPLLSVPQLTHYILDGFIWKTKKE